MKTEPVEFGFSSITYTEKDVELIKESLGYNGRSVSAAYMIITEYGSPEVTSGEPQEKIHLIERIFDELTKPVAQSYGRNPSS